MFPGAGPPGRGGSDQTRGSGCVIRSTSTRSSRDNFQLTALTFCSTCSGFVAPAMMLDTNGSAASQLKASSRMVRPWLEQKLSNASTFFQFDSVRNRFVNGEDPLRQAPRGSLSRLYFAKSERSGG